jgi:hypothetical protein
MYLTSTQPNIMGPGTGLVQRYGWTPQMEKQMRGAFGRGMGCNCSGGLGCKCGGGLGLFDSGMDPSGWGLPEFGIVVGGLYVLFSVLGDTKRGARRISGSVRGAYRGASDGGGKRKRNPGRRRRSRR